MTALANQDYVAERSLATTLFLAYKMQRPLFLEGEPGVGKTEIAKVLAHILAAKLIRLQCYEGLDLNSAAYEWNYAKQMLALRAQETPEKAPANTNLYDRSFLTARPLLEALEATQHQPIVLLIDELDRADEAFEAYLLELLSDYQITIPELGTIRALQPPFVLITSNRTREIHDALKRRCLYYWVEFPSLEKELEIVRRRLPDLSQNLTHQVVSFVQALRQTDLYKLPGLAETLDWSRALQVLAIDQLTPAVIDETLGTLLKYHEDVLKTKGAQVQQLLKSLSP